MLHRVARREGKRWVQLARARTLASQAPPEAALANFAAEELPLAADHAAKPLLHQLAALEPPQPLLEPELLAPLADGDDGTASPDMAPTMGAAALEPPLMDASALNAIAPADATAGPPLAEPAALGMWPSDFALRLVDSVHELGVPWWGAIVVTALTARVVLLPVTIYGMQQAGRLQAMKPQLAALSARLNAGGSNEEQIKTLREVQELYAKNNTTPMGAIVPAFAQMPVFLSFFMGLRRLAEVRPDAASGGALWFTDLGASDPTYTLPVVSTASAFALLLISMPKASSAASAAEQQQVRLMRTVFSVLTLVSLPVASSMPASVLVFWCTNNAFSLGWTSTLNYVPGAREALNIPKPAPFAMPGADVSSPPQATPVADFEELPAETSPGSGQTVDDWQADVQRFTQLAKSLAEDGKVDDAEAARKWAAIAQRKVDAARTSK